MLGEQWGSEAEQPQPPPLKCSFLFLLLLPDFIFRAPIKLSKPGELREEYESQLRKVRSFFHCGFSCRIPSRNTVQPVRMMKGIQFLLWNNVPFIPFLCSNRSGMCWQLSNMQEVVSGAKSCFPEPGDGHRPSMVDLTQPWVAWDLSQHPYLWIKSHKKPIP